MPLRSLTIRAPAKINLFLHILNQKPNGYHSLQTLFQFVSLYDTLSFHLETDPNLQFSSTAPAIAESDQLVLKAARLLQQSCQCQKGARIFLEKNIPMAAGLGGGSSDAAATLLALNHLWGCGLDNLALQQLGVQLGADVPIFIHGHSAFASDIGATLEAAAPPEIAYVIVKPDCDIVTRDLFNHPDLPRHTPAIAFSDYRYEQCHNDFEALARRLYPMIESVCLWLANFGQPRMTGTGSCIFLPLVDIALWPTIQAECPDNCSVYLTQGLNVSPTQLDLANSDYT